MIDMPYAVILKSRQSKTPVGGDPWVVSTRKAVLHALDRGHTIIGSLGLNTWELVTWIAGDCGGRVLVFVPFPYHKNIYDGTASAVCNERTLTTTILKEFDLDPSRTRLHYQDTPARTGTRKSSWPIRDKEIIERADIIYPISIRPGGSLEVLIAQAGSSKKICKEFCTAYQRRKSRGALIPGDRTVDRTLSGGPWPYITHWTRAADGKWPGETAASYYRDITFSRDTYARSGLATLLRIIGEKRLRASNRHIRGKFPVVPFSAHPPAEAIKLMRWRKRFVRYNFEPYGIAIRKDFARSIGVRPVTYGIPEDFAGLDKLDRPFFQNRGVRGGDWEPENEWRHLGDLDLSEVPPNEFKIIVRSPAEKTCVESVANAEVVALFV